MKQLERETMPGRKDAGTECDYWFGALFLDTFSCVLLRNRLAVVFLATMLLMLPSRVSAEIIPISVSESEFAFDVTFEWTEEGTEEPFVVPGFDDWVVRLRIFDNTETTGLWDLDVLAFHSADPHVAVPPAQTRLGASGGIVASFDKGLFGQVLDEFRVGIHKSYEPPEGYIPPPQTPHVDSLFLEVFRESTPGVANPNTIRIRGVHIPEPSAAALLALAVVFIGLASRRLRRRTARATFCN